MKSTHSCINLKLLLKKILEGKSGKHVCSLQISLSLVNAYVGYSYVIKFAVTAHQSLEGHAFPNLSRQQPPDSSEVEHK